MERIDKVKMRETKEFSHNILERFWEKVDTGRVPGSNGEHRESLVSLLENAQEETVCIQAEYIKDNGIVKAIMKAARQGCRVYILTNEREDKLKELTGCCLMRYGVRNMGSFILVNPGGDNSKGILVTAPLAEGALLSNHNRSIPLNYRQVEELYRLFCDSFWNYAGYEIIDNFASPIETGEPPLDFLPSLDNCCAPDYLSSRLKESSRAAQGIVVPLLERDDPFWESRPEGATIYTALKGHDEELFAELAGHNSLIAPAEERFSSLRAIYTGDKGWLIPKSYPQRGDRLFALELDDRQLKSLKGGVESFKRMPHYRYVDEKRREQLVGSALRELSDIDREYVIKEQSSIDCGTINSGQFLSKEEYLAQRPRMDDDAESCRITYSWEIVPYYTPENSERDRLYRDWEQFEQSYRAKIEEVEQAIEKAESSKHSLADGVKGFLKRIFLSKGQKFNECRESLEELKKVKPEKYSSEECNSHIERLNMIIAQVKESGAELESEISFARKMVDWEERGRKLQEQVEQAQQSCKVKSEELERCKEDAKCLLEEKKREIESRKQQFMEENEVTDLDEFKSELQKRSSKKNRKNNPEDAKEAGKILQELNSIPQIHILQNKVDGDRKKLENEQNRLQGELKGAEQDLEKHKSAKPVKEEQGSSENSVLSAMVGSKKNKKGKKGGSRTGNGLSSFQVKIPVELPSTGTLLSNGSKRYLEIKYWEDAERARSEALRLEAELSVKRGD